MPTDNLLKESQKKNISWRYKKFSNSFQSYRLFTFINKNGMNKDSKKKKKKTSGLYTFKVHFPSQVQETAKES